MGLTGAVLMYFQSESLSKIHKEVRLYDMVIQNDALSSLELQAFYGQERRVEDLAAEVAVIQKEFRMGSVFTGGFIGLVIALTLINLSIKRTRKSYEIDQAHCVGCGRCFPYCPQK
jgi:NAD-dependent dihydropyrimidine dehydrogenase PreA subunit